MIFTETKLKGAFIIDLDRKTDERGFFARAFCQNEFRDHGLKPVIAQANVASNEKKGTLRGMHFNPPAAESKLVRCTRGAPRHHCRSAAREPDLPRAHLRRAQRGQYDGAVCSGALRARLSGAARQHGHELPSGRSSNQRRINNRPSLDIWSTATNTSPQLRLGRYLMRSSKEQGPLLRSVSITTSSCADTSLGIMAYLTLG